MIVHLCLGVYCDNHISFDARNENIILPIGFHTVNYNLSWYFDKLMFCQVNMTNTVICPNSIDI